MADPVSGGLMVASALMQAKSTSDAANYNASVDQTNSQQALETGAQTQVADLAKARAVEGDSLAASAANGVAVGTGSALDSIRQSAINAQFDVLNARNAATAKSNAYLADASAQKAKAKSAILSGLLGAGAKALGAGALGSGGSGGSGTSVPGGSAMPMPSSDGYSISTMSGYSGGLGG